MIKNLPANTGDVRNVKRPARNESVAELCFETQGKIHTHQTTFMHHATSSISLFLLSPPFSFLYFLFLFLHYFNIIYLSVILFLFFQTRGHIESCRDKVIKFLLLIVLVSLMSVTEIIPFLNHSSFYFTQLLSPGFNNSRDMGYWSM